jgi:DNA-binding GntR family transcriptional regulator
MVRLENAGLVEAETAKMARVRKITIQTIQNDYVLRMALEVEAIRLASETATAGEIKELYRLAEAVDARISLRDHECPGAGRPGRDGAGGETDLEGLRIHWRFHRRIAEVSRFPVLVREMERSELLRRLQACWFYMPEMVNPPRMHSLLVEPIERRDPEAAAAAMRAHVQRGLEKELLSFRMKMNR